MMAAVVGIAIFAWVQREAIGDWAALRGYQPPAAISQLAAQSTMTPLARHYFYVNRPRLEGRDTFNQQCTNKTEQTVVLGCYHGDRRGIYLFDVNVQELDGVKQVTAAHEMLHQAYDRLSDSERARIDALLQQYADGGLQDQAIKDQIAGYKKSEPNDVVNEMHSLFGTEVANLPPELEQYYAQYFTDRSSVVKLYNNYQLAFTSRNQKIAQYDTQLGAMKAEIDTLQSALDVQLQTLNQQQAAMNQKRASGDAAGYNQLVPEYNRLVNTYNANLATLESKIEAYNQLVQVRNSVAVQEQQLQQDLSSQKLPSMSSQ